MTLDQVFEKVFRKKWDKERYRRSGWAKEVRQYYQRNVSPYFGDKRVTDIGPKAIRHWHGRMEETPIAANRSLEVLSAVLTFAEGEELIPVGSNPCRAVRGFPERKRSRFASPEELQRIGQVLRDRAEKEPLKVAFVNLLALTGARPRSLQRARRDQLDMREEFAILRFHGKTSEKTGEEETLVIPKSAVEPLLALPPRRDGLLLGPVSYRRFWESVCREANCQGLWLRDLRRTFGTVGLSSGVELDKIGEVLNHRSIATTQRYAKLLPSARVDTVREISAKVSALMAVPA